MKHVCPKRFCDKCAIVVNNDAMLWIVRTARVTMLPFLTISRQKYDLNFRPLKVIQGQIWRYRSKARGYSYIILLLASNLVFVTVLEIFRIKGLWPWPLISQGHPKWSPWTLYIISIVTPWFITTRGSYAGAVLEVVILSVCLSVRHTRVLWQNQTMHCGYLIPQEGQSL